MESLINNGDNKYMTSEHNYGIKSLITPAATGGNTITTSGNYRIHTFTSTGTFTVNKSMNATILIVAGGGGAGSQTSGGGGAGGLLYTDITIDVNPSIQVTVGNGGAGGRYWAVGANGENSSFQSLVAIGGGGGGRITDGTGRDGGSGGGGAKSGGGGSCITMGGNGVTGQGKNGGCGSSGAVGETMTGAGGGGGGAGQVGGNTTGSNFIPGNGGNGLSYDISGANVYYAGGGGGGTVPSTGGLGGGGNGTAGTSGGNGIANSGGGGGGVDAPSGNGIGGNGGSGIVIIRYPMSYDLTPANITATSMAVSPPSESPCRAGICTVGVSVTWTNTGESTGSSDLSITVGNGTSTISPLSYPSESFTANQTKGPYTFTVSNMTAGTHSICPNPS